MTELATIQTQAPPPDISGGAPASTADAFQPTRDASEFDRIANATVEEQRAFMGQLSPQELEHVNKTGTFKGLFKEAAATDPASAAPAPAANAQEPAKAPEAAAPEAGPDADAPWLGLTPEELKSAHPALQALFDAHAELADKVQSIQDKPQIPVDDPVIAWRLRGLETGELEIPVAPTIAELGGDELLRSLDEAYQKEDPNVWKTAAADLVNRTARETAARLQINLQPKIEEAYALGETRATFRADLKHFVSIVPEFKGEQKELYVTGPEGNLVTNREHPAHDFVKWINDQAVAGVLNDAFVKRNGFAAVWDLYRADKAGGYGNLQVQRRAEAAKSMAERMRSIRQASIQAQVAPSVGAMQTGGGQARAAELATYHGADLQRMIDDRNYATAQMESWDRAGDRDALNGVQQAINNYASALPRR